jgi:hypothetical protein
MALVNIVAEKLTSAIATASYVIRNPSKYATAAEGMPCESILRSQLPGVRNESQLSVHPQALTLFYLRFILTLWWFIERVHATDE